VPSRRCVGCGRVAPKQQLLRIALERQGAASTGRAVPDERGTLGGRGAYLCREHSGGPVGACLQRALQRGSIARTLRAAARLDVELVESLSR
jgi:predicted RNA-binding protein YlxR (DUF448 family)